MTLFQRLKDACPTDWAAYADHAFVRGLGDGSLPQAAFRFYLVQDYRFLIHFARAHALAAFKADRLEDIRDAAATVGAIVDREMALHVDYCRGWGISPAEMEATPEAVETMAYTRYVLETGLSGDLLDLEVALAPCIVGYGEIGAALAARGVSDDNPYASWIEAYAGEDYRAVAAAAVARLDRVFARRGSEARMDGLVRIFGEATRLEARFWQMGLDAAG